MIYLPFRLPFRIPFVRQMGDLLPPRLLRIRIAEMESEIEEIFRLYGPELDDDLESWVRALRKQIGFCRIGLVAQGCDSKGP